MPKSRQIPSKSKPMKNLLTGPKIRIFPEELLAFFDQEQQDKDYGTHTSAITGMIGEDLVLGLFIDHLERKGVKNLALISYKCTTGKKTGPRLDAWISSAGNVLRQVEVKNWAANAIGGEHVDPKAKKKAVAVSANLIFKRYFTDPKVKQKVLKVLKPMSPPKGYKAFKRLPTLAVWSVVSDGCSLPPCFRIKNIYRHKKEFQLLEVFSASLYLRKHGDRKSFKIYMPRFTQRMDLLKGFTDLT